MLTATEFGTGQVLWSLVWFFLFFVWIMLIFSIFGDIIRSDDLSGVGKAVWAAFIIFLPFLGIFMYLIVRGNKMSSRQMTFAQQQEEAVRDYIRSTATTSPADQLATLAGLHSEGKLSDEEYARAKADVIRS